MPSGYAGRGMKYLRNEGRWVQAKKEQVFDYDHLRHDIEGLIISFFRWYPDYYADLFRSETATYKLELPQRMMLRIDARYRNNYQTGVRGLTKTYVKLLGKMIKGELYPGIVMRYIAPNQKQAASLATQAFHQIEKDYPFIASHWKLRNDRADMFRITTDYGSEFTMYAPRGDNCSETIAEEIGQESPDPFDMSKYEKDILPTCRIVRNVNQKPDTVHINLQHSHISNACSKHNRAFSVHRAGVLKQMLFGEKYEGFVIDFSWITALMGNIRDISYIKDMKSKLSQQDWLREMCARYTGSDDNPMISDEVLTKSQRLLCMEDKHCGDPNAIYIVAHDVSYVDSAKNAKCADVVLKLTKYTSTVKRDKYRKQAVYVDAYPPPATAYLQAQKLKDLWRKFCLAGGETTYLLVDAQAYGTEIVEELMKPTSDGSLPLGLVAGFESSPFKSLEQRHCVNALYPLKSGSRGATDEEGVMIQYAQLEFEQGNVELLIPSVLDGVEAYKEKHGIKDSYSDGKIAAPYKKTSELVQQITNLRTKASGLTLKEERKSMAIQRDIWSALKYALRLAQRLESADKIVKYATGSSWEEIIANGAAGIAAATAQSGARNKLLALRKR